MDNYNQLVERISRSSGLKTEEIERKIEAKKAKLSGLISKEGAAQIVAAELGINFAQEKLKISELVEGMKRANVLGKVLRINPVREFNKNGREGKVGSFLLADSSSNVRVVLWDTNHISLIEKAKIKEGSIVDISNGNMRNGELHLSSFGDIKISNEKIENVVSEKVYSEKKLSDSRAGEGLKTRATIVKTFEPRYFEVCPECSKKVVDDECKTHGKIKPKKRALLSLILDDGSESMRTTLFGDQILQLGLSEEEIFSLEEYAKVKDNILGEEKVFTGTIKTNALYNVVEFNVEKVEEPDLDELTKELEAKVK